MNFTCDKITEDDRIWAVRYNDQEDNELYKLFENWNDVSFLRSFFTEHKDDLSKNFRILNVDVAIKDTLEDASELEAVILDFDENTDLDSFFTPLRDGNPDYYLERSKGKGEKRRGHASWLRIYALKIKENSYLITGGAIKLTHTMQEKEHTLKELSKLFSVRQSLWKEEGIVDGEGFEEYIKYR